MRKQEFFSPPAVGSLQKAGNDVYCLKNRRRRDKGKDFFLRPDAESHGQGFYKYLANKDRAWKYQDLADTMRTIASEDEYNDAYGRIRMYQALLLKQPKDIRIPSERTVYLVMEEIRLSHRPKRKPNGITTAELNQESVICSSFEGAITDIGRKVGDRTPDAGAIICADYSIPYQFSTFIDKEQKKYMNQRDEITQLPFP